MPEVMTVLGPVPADKLGRVMPHEHLLSLAPGPWLGWAAANPDEAAVELAVDALSGLGRLGFGTVVDLSPYNVVGRDEHGDNARLLAEISRRSGLHIVSGTAIYLDSYAPGWSRGADVATIAARLLRDVREGIGTSGVRAGILGEQATGLDVMTPHEETCLRAAARVCAETGLALMTHTTHGTLVDDQLDLLRQEGAELDRVVIGHLDTQLELDPLLRVIDAGALAAIDTIGKQEWDFFLGPPGPSLPDGEFAKRAFRRGDEGRADLVAELVRRGLADRLVLAQDLTGAETWMNPATHGRHGYRYLHEIFRPMLAQRGVGAEVYDQMTIATPARLLAVPA